MGPSIEYIRTSKGGEDKSLIYFHCVLHAKRGDGIKIAGVHNKFKKK